jgi:hypothetical protein
LDFRTLYFKKGLLRQCVEILSEETSINSTVNISKDKQIIWNNKYIDIDILRSNCFTIQWLKWKQQIPLVSITGHDI